MSREIEFEFVFQHVDSREVRFKRFTLDEIANGFEDDLFILECDCEPVGETNVVECNCEDYLEDFRIIDKRQYTGLKDKNDNGIYEGDIVKQAVDCNNDLHGEYTYHEVKFNNGSFLVSYLKSETGFKLPRGYTAGFMTDIIDRSAKIILWSKEALSVDEFEIIGNIYENPELISND